MKILIYATTFGADLLSLTRYLSEKENVEIKVLMKEVEKFKNEGIYKLWDLDLDIFEFNKINIIKGISGFDPDVTILDNNIPLRAVSPKALILWHGYGWKGPNDEEEFKWIHRNIRLSWGDMKIPNSNIKWLCFGPVDFEHRTKISGFHPENCVTLGSASEELRALLIELGADPAKVKVYHLGIDLSKFDYQEPNPAEQVNFVMIGRFTPKKAHLYVLRAFDKIIKDGMNASLTFIGSGDLKNEALKFVEENDLSAQVTFKGILTPEEVSEVLKSSDVLVAPSVVAFNQDRESGLIVIKEAGSVGVPAIGTWHGGIHEIIDDGKTGFLIPERNIPDLIQKMKLFIQQPELIKKFGKASRLKMEKDYDLFNQVTKLEELYEEAIREHERI